MLKIFSYVGAIFFAFVLPAQAYELYKVERVELNADINAAYGLFSSQESYDQVRNQPGSQNWQEGFVKYGLSGHYMLDLNSRVYGAARLISTASWDDGDAAGFTTGSERRSNVEDAYVGWKSGHVFTVFGEDGFDFSLGRQRYAVGSGFLLYGDTLNFGKGFNALAPQSLNRGGAYYLAARESFGRTAILRLAQSGHLHGTVFWLKSDNKAQAKTELAGLNVEYEQEHYGALGLTYLKGLSVNKQLADFLGYEHRDGQDTVAIRANGSAGIKHLLLAGEYVHQDNGSAGKEEAWYAGFGWKFSDIPWQPDIGARYSRFSSAYDPLFYSMSSGYGTWYQGEVAGNYAGPFNTNADVAHLYLTAKPINVLSLGVLFFDFQTRNKHLENLDATEWDIYAEWKINDHFSVSPLIGFYAPDKKAAMGGTQLGNSRTNTYVEVTVAAVF